MNLQSCVGWLDTTVWSNRDSYIIVNALKKRFCVPVFELNAWIYSRTCDRYCMRVLLLLSREHPTLPKAEIEGVLEGEGIGYDIMEEDSEERLLLVDVKTRKRNFARRLALTKKALEYIGSSEDLGRLSELVRRRIKKGSSFRVSCESNSVEKKLGRLIHEKGIPVDLSKPDVEVVCLLHRGYTCGLNIPLDRGFEKRRPQHRPFFHPTSMHPKVARLLVNLSRVGKGDVVFDPFCGTGGILIEAGLMGLGVLGCDVDARMTRGCSRNLRHYGIGGRVFRGDALDLQGDLKADAIVTDPPYGRSSYSSDRNLAVLYDRFVSNASSVIRSGGHMVLVLPAGREVDFNGFEVVGRHDLRVHRSLTRRIWALRKS